MKKPRGDPDHWGDKGFWNQAEIDWLNENVERVCQHPSDVRLAAYRYGWYCPCTCGQSAVGRQYRVSE